MRTPWRGVLTTGQMFVLSMGRLSCHPLPLEALLMLCFLQQAVHSSPPSLEVLLWIGLLRDSIRHSFSTNISRTSLAYAWNTRKAWYQNKRACFVQVVDFAAVLALETNAIVHYSLDRTSQRDTTEGTGLAVEDGCSGHRTRPNTHQDVYQFTKRQR